MGLETFARQSAKTIKHHAPTILTGISVAGIVGTAYFASKAGYDTANLVREFENKENGLWIQSSAKEKIALGWKNYIPTILVAGVTIACTVGSHGLSMRRQTALIGAYTLSERAFSEYREQVREKLADKKADTKVVDAVATDDVAKNPPSQTEFIHLREGDQMFRDKWSGRYFMSTMDKVRKAEITINNSVIKHDYALLNEFYAEIGLESIDAGDEVGFNNGRLLELDFSAVPFEDKAIMVVSFKRPPVVNPFGPW